MPRITGATPATPLVVNSGSITNINDNDITTKVEVQGVISNFEFYTLDLGSSKHVTQAQILGLYETNTGGFPDSGFAIYYSDNPINSGNTGTIFGASFTAGASPSTIDSTQNGDAIARYWAFTRSGDFHNNAIGINSFNLFDASSASSSLSPSPSSSVSPSSSPSTSVSSSPSPSAGGGNIFFDGFDRANSTNLGSNWTEQQGDLEILTNTLTNLSTRNFVNNNAVECIATYNPVVPFADYIVSADLTNPRAPGNGSAALIARWTDNTNFYFARIDPTSGLLELYSKLNNVTTQLGNLNISSLGKSLTAKYHVALRLQGSILTVTVDGTKILTVTNTDHSTAGHAGVRLFAWDGVDGIVDNFSLDKLDVSSSSSSISPSPSPTPSSSISASPSPSQAAGSGLYSKGFLSSLPANKSNLAIVYGAYDEEDVESSDGFLVSIEGSVPSYVIHQFRRINTNKTDNIKIRVKVKCELAPTSSPVYLQVWHSERQIWRTLDSNSVESANTPFVLDTLINDHPERFYDANKEVAFRVYQQLI